MSTHNKPAAPTHLSEETACLLTDLVAYFRNFVDISPQQAIAMALWVMFSHTHDAFNISALLALLSPTMRCAKSTVLDLLGAVTPEPIRVTSATGAVLFRMIDGANPTVLLDEFDSSGVKNEAIRAILNSGYSRTEAWVPRCGPGGSVIMYNTYCPKVIGCIGSMNGTLMDRSIKIRMHRKAQGKNVERLVKNRLQDGTFEPLRQRLAAWGYEATDVLSEMDPLMPESFNDRARDNWRPSFAIAEFAGEQWLKLATKAALAIEMDYEFEEDPKVHVIRALQSVCAEFPATAQRYPTAKLIAGVNQLVATGEADGITGSLTPQALGRILTDFGVRSCKWREGNTTPHGYHRDDLKFLFDRYGVNEPVSEAGTTSTAPDEATVWVEAEVASSATLVHRQALESHPVTDDGTATGVH